MDQTKEIKNSEEKIESPLNILEEGRRYIDENLLDTPELDAEGFLLEYFDSNNIRGQKKDYLKRYFKKQIRVVRTVPSTEIDYSSLIKGDTESERLSNIKASIRTIWVKAEESSAMKFITDICAHEGYGEDKKALLIDYYKSEKINKVEEEDGEKPSLYTDEFINYEIKKKWKNYILPKAKYGEYIMGDTGIYREEKRASEDGKEKQSIIYDVCRTPFVLCGVSIPMTDTKVHFKIRYKDYMGEVKEFWMPYNDLMNRRGLQAAFADNGINCPENEVLKEALEYISLSINEFQARYKKEFAAKQCGWNEDKTKFVIGNRVITKDGIEEILVVGEKGVFNELTPKGSLELWVEAVQPILKHELARFKFYDAFTAPINHLLGVESHMTDHYGDTSEGKSLTAKIAISGVGNPNEGISCRADSTAKSTLANIGKHSDLPFLIDETGMAKEDFPQVIYGITNELGRTKLTKDGDLIPGGIYRSTTLLTGENSLRDILKFSGQMFRVLEVNETIGYIDPKTIETVYNAIKENFGHIIDLYMEEVFRLKEDGKLKEIFDECLTVLPETSSKVEGRQKRTFACIMVAGRILETVFRKIGITPANPEEIVCDYFIKCVSDKPIEMEHIRALRILFDWVQSDYGSFTMCTSDDVQMEGKGFQRNGYIDEHYIDIIGANFSKKLEEHGLKPTKIKERLAKEGLIAPKVGKNWQFSRERKGVNGIRIYRGLAEEALGLGAEKKDSTRKPYINEENAVYIIVECLTKVRGRADRQLIDAIADNINTDYVLNSLVKDGLIDKISENSYMHK